MPRKGRLDFERGVPKEARDTIAAMTMTRGGLIIHGVDNGRNIAGCPLSGTPGNIKSGHSDSSLDASSPSSLSLEHAFSLV